MYTATGHNNAVLSLDVMGDLMITGSKGWFTLLNFYRLKFVSYGMEAWRLKNDTPLLTLVLAH